MFIVRCLERAIEVGFRTRAPTLAAATVMVCCTLAGGSSVAFAYRTASDLVDFADTERVRWESSTISVKRTPWLPPSLSSADVDNAIAIALLAWSSLECPTVTFVNEGVVPGSAVDGDGVVSIQFVGNSWVQL